MTTFFLFIQLSFHFHFIKRLWFWRQCSRFNLQGDFSIFYVEIMLSSFKGRLASLRWFFCFVFVSKSKTVESVDMTVWIAHICQIFAESSQFLQVQILGTCFISDRENVGWKNVQHSFWFCFVPPLWFITIPYSSCIIYFMFTIMKSHLIISPQL